jgi:UDP-3-O-[3-hydroxymyristoyl] glucosamine N-acyltransferase
LISEDPFNDFNRLTNHFKPFESSGASISTSAVGEGLYSGLLYGNHVVIGKNCLIHTNVAIYDNTIIGNNVIIHAGTVLGADAFYYKRRRIRSIAGRKSNKNNVDIGAFVQSTKGLQRYNIGEGTKLTIRFM